MHPPVVLDTSDDTTLTIEGGTGEVLDEEKDAAESKRSLGNMVDNRTSALVEGTDPETGSRSSSNRSTTPMSIKGKK